MKKMSNARKQYRKGLREMIKLINEATRLEHEKAIRAKEKKKQPPGLSTQNAAVLVRTSRSRNVPPPRSTVRRRAPRGR